MVSSGKGRFLAIHSESPATPVRREHPCPWDDCAISRLRLGHVDVAVHLHRFQLLESPACRCRQVETVEHFLLNCDNYSARRQPLKRLLQCLDLQFNLKNVFGGGDYLSRVQLRIIRGLAQFLSTVGSFFKYDYLQSIVCVLKGIGGRYKGPSQTLALNLSLLSVNRRTWRWNEGNTRLCLQCNRGVEDIVEHLDLECSKYEHGRESLMDVVHEQYGENQWSEVIAAVMFIT
ncbi:hypothetical protein FHG87_017547 [Trinorchestia longiramus]|nr:hypothetical protein FHG87_017547 [Trinorchestia longiramus]